MFIFISNKHLQKLECIMSKFLDDFHMALAKVASTQNDAAAIKALQDLMLENKATNDEQNQAILELTNTLGQAPPMES